MMTSRELNDLARHQRDDRALRQIDDDLLHRAGEPPDWIPVDQAQEHRDHVAGMASDHQNAFALSQMQHRSGLQGVNVLLTGAVRRPVE